MISTLSSPLNVSVPAAVAYNRSHTRMATCSQSTLTVWEGGSGDPLWMRLANLDTAQPALSNVRCLFHLPKVSLTHKVGPLHA